MTLQDAAKALAQSVIYDDMLTDAPERSETRERMYLEAGAIMHLLSKGVEK